MLISWRLIPGIFDIYFWVSGAKPIHTWTRQNDFVLFFPVRDIPLRFIALNVFFSAPIGRIYPFFV